MGIRDRYAVMYNSEGGQQVLDMPEEQTKEKDVDLTLSENVPTRKGYAVQCLLVLQQVVAAGAGGNDVDSREDTLVGQVSVCLLYASRCV